MSRLRHILTRDLGRKMLALLLALVVWWRVNLGIQDDETVQFVIATERVPSSAANVIEVVAPSGWLLVSPKPGETYEITFKGVNADRQAFLGEGVRARVRVATSQGRGDNSTGRLVSERAPDELDWPDPSRATELLPQDSNKSPLRLEFEPLATRQIALTRDLLQVEGGLDAGYELGLDEVQFLPNVVQIEGPRDKLVELDQGGVETLADLFEPVTIAPRRDAIHTNLRLSQRATESGLRIVQTTIDVVIPVHPQGLRPFTLVPTTSSIELIGTPPDPSTRWEVQSYSGGGFEVHYAGSAGIDPPPDRASLEDAIIFFVDLSDMPDGADNGQRLMIDWVVRDPSGIDDPARRQAFKHAVSLVPTSTNASSREVILNKTDES